MSQTHCKLYQTRSINVYPYQDVISVRPVALDSLVEVDCDLRDHFAYRMYRPGHAQYVSVAPIELLEEQWEWASGPETSPFQLRASNRFAMQIEYVVFDSYRMTDHAVLQPIIDRIRKGSLTLADFPAAIRPERIIMEADDRSHPWDTLRLEGTQPPLQSTSAFYVSTPHELPIINHHTIPDGLDFDFVQAAAVHYVVANRLPIYGELLANLDRYCQWFDKMLAR